MTADEILNERLKRIDNIPGRFVSKVSATQDEIFAELIEILSQLKTNKGNLVLSPDNLILLDELMSEYYEVLRKGKYGSLVSGFISEMDVQKGLINQFSEIEYNVVASVASEAVYTQSRATAVRQLLGDDFKTNFINVIRDQIISSIENQMSFKEMTTGLRGSFVNGDVLGQIVNWTNQVASDRFSITDRSYSSAVAQQLELVFGQYAGGLIKDSREFCVERDSKFFHINEVHDWGNIKQWQGRYRRTTPDNIMQWLGGFRCQHLFIFRSLASVPKVVIERNIANGNFKPSAAEKSLLNL